MLTEADDHLHPGRTDDRSWTETCWFAAAAPERGLGIWTYPLFRPELGVMSCGIYVWEPGREELWELPYHRTWWHMPLAEDLDLTSMTLPNGLRYERLEPLTAYRIAYADDDEIALDLTFRAIHPPHAVGVAEGHGHIDQLGRVTGELTLRGERIPIDCFEMRDRTWSARRETRQRAYVTYSYGTRSATDAFHVSTRLDHRTGRQVLLTGYVLRDGAVLDLADGACAVERDDRGRPVRVRVTAHGPDGAEVEVEGEVLSRMAHLSTPWFAWPCIVRWTLPDGTRCYGEHQDTWGTAALRAMLDGRSASG